MNYLIKLLFLYFNLVLFISLSSYDLLKYSLMEPMATKSFDSQ